MLKKKESSNPIALISAIIAYVITPLDLSPEDQDFVNNEIKWLFNAVYNFQQIYEAVQQNLADEENKLKEQFKKELAGLYVLQKKRLEEGMAEITPQVWQKILAQSQPVAVSIPPDAERQHQADNRLLSSNEVFWLNNWYDQIPSQLNQITSYLANLKRLLDREGIMGAEGKNDIALQNQIKLARLEIVRVLQQMAQLINEAYGIKVTSPEQLIEIMMQY